MSKLDQAHYGNVGRIEGVAGQHGAQGLKDAVVPTHAIEVERHVSHVQIPTRQRFGKTIHTPWR